MRQCGAGESMWWSLIRCISCVVRYESTHWDVCKPIMLVYFPLLARQFRLYLRAGCVQNCLNGYNRNVLGLAFNNAQALPFYTDDSLKLQKDKT